MVFIKLYTINLNKNIESLDLILFNARMLKEIHTVLATFSARLVEFSAVLVKKSKRRAQNEAKPKGCF